MATPFPRESIFGTKMLRGLFSTVARRQRGDQWCLHSLAFGEEQAQTCSIEQGALGRRPASSLGYHHLQEAKPLCPSKVGR